MPPKKETLEIGMTSFRLFLWKSKNEWLVWSLAKTVPLPNGPSPLHGRFELSIAPMNNYGHALKLFLCSATIAVWSGQFYQVILLHTIDMYTRIGGVSLLNQTIPTNFSIISTLNWWSVSMRGVFLSTTAFLGSLPTWKPFSAIVCLPLAHAKYLLESSRRVSNVEKCTNSRKA